MHFSYFLIIFHVAILELWSFSCLFILLIVEYYAEYMLPR